jgi:hypothetical protein
MVAGAGSEAGFSVSQFAFQSGSPRQEAARAVSWAAITSVRPRAAFALSRLSLAWL